MWTFVCVSVSECVCECVCVRECVCECVCVCYFICLFNQSRKIVYNVVVNHHHSFTLVFHFSPFFVSIKLCTGNVLCKSCPSASEKRLFQLIIIFSNSFHAHSTPTLDAYSTLTLDAYSTLTLDSKSASLTAQTISARQQNPATLSNLISVSNIKLVLSRPLSCFRSRHLGHWNP